MPVNSRQKGARGEREFASVLREHGWKDARRGVQYSGKTGAADVVGDPYVHWEIKRRKRINVMDAYDQANRDAKPGEIPIVAFRLDNCPWMIATAAEHFLPILMDYENGKELDDGQVTGQAQ